jgi:hypothetical protein
MRKAFLIFLGILLFSFVLAETYLLGDVVVYDTFNDGIVNTTKFINATSLGGANSINTITETGGYMEIISQFNGGSGEYDVQTNSSLFPPLEQIKNLTFTVALSSSGGVSKAILRFGTQTLWDSSASGDDTSTWRLDRQSNGNFLVYNDGSLQTTITPTNNQVYFRHTQGGTGGNYARSRIYSMNYTTYDPRVNFTSIYPLDGATIPNSHVNLSLQLEPHNATITNATFVLWNPDTSVRNYSIIPIWSNVSTEVNFSVYNLDFANVYSWNALVCGLNNSARCEWYNYDSNVTFTSVGISEYYESELIELQSATNLLNLTFNNINTSISAFLIWNGSQVSTTKNVIDSDTVSFSSSFNVPSGIGTTDGNNISFYWNYYLNDNSINSTTESHNQTIYSLDLDTCSVYTNPFMNLTIVDEDDLSTLNGTTQNTSIDIEFTLKTADGTNTVNINETFTGVNPASICVNTIPSSSGGLNIDSTIKYSADNYVTEYYGIQNESYDSDNFPKLITLYDLISSRSQEFLINVKDSNFIPLSGALVEITKRYINLGNFLTVEIPETDTDGRTIGHFVLNDEIYTINIKKDGVLLATFENVRAFCTNTATGNCQIDLNELASTTKIKDFQADLGASFYNTYNATTRTYKFVFINGDSSQRDFAVRGNLFDGYQNTTVCSDSVTATSGTLTCTVSTQYQNKTIVFESLIDSIVVDTKVIKTDLLNIEDATRYALGVLGVLVMALIGIPSGPVVTLILFIVGFLFIGAFALLEGSILGVGSAFLWLIVAVGIILFKIRRKDG